MIPLPLTLLFWVLIYTPFLCFLSREYPLVFVGELVWWCRILSAFADLSIETLQARREWQNILKVMKENNLHPRLLYPARSSFKYEGEIKRFIDKQKLGEFRTTKPALQQMLKDIL